MIEPVESSMFSAKLNFEKVVDDALAFDQLSNHAHDKTR